jgi:hypothetical protein
MSPSSYVDDMDEVHVSGLLGDDMFDLYARVHLDNSLLATLAHQELGRSGVTVADRTSEADHILAHRVPEAPGKVRGWRHLEYLLVTPLHRAVNLVEVVHLSSHVGERAPLRASQRFALKLNRNAVKHASTCAGVPLRREACLYVEAAQ